MAATDFVDYSPATPIRAAWLNDADALVYDVFGAASTVAAARTALSVTDENIQDLAAAMFTNSATITWAYNDAAGTITANVVSGGLDHGTLPGLADDDHTQYVLLAGRVGGQAVYGGTAAGNSLTLHTTSNAVKGTFSVDTDVIYKDASGNVGFGTSSPARRVHGSLNDATTNGVSYVARLTHSTSGTPAAGIGVGVEYEVQGLAGNVVAARVSASYTNVTGGAEVSDFIISTVGGGLQESAKINVTGVGQGMSGRTIRGPFHARAAGKHFIMESDSASAYLNYFETTSEGVVHLRGNTLTMSNLQTLVTWSQSPATGNTAMSLPGPGSSITLNGGSSVSGGALSAIVKGNVNAGPVDVLTVGLTRSAGLASAGAGPRINFTCTTSDTDNQELGGAIAVVSTDIAAGSEDFKMVFYTQAAGAAISSRGHIGLGWVVGSAAGGDQGSSTINATNYYRDGVLLSNVPTRSWTNVTGSRAQNTVYQNTSGHERHVAITATYGAAESGALLVGSSNPPTTVVQQSFGSTGQPNLYAAVPAGHYYEWDTSGGTGSLVVWSEYA